MENIPNILDTILGGGYYVVGFVLLLGVLIVVHEVGHFLVAKVLDVKVLKFSIGFPPAIVKRKWGETEYILSGTPLGGYVKLLGEDPESKEEIPPEDEHRAFVNKPLLSRTAIIIAGPLANYLLALVLFCGTYVVGLPVLSTNIGKILPDSPAREAGLEPGDRVVAINGTKVWRWDDMRSTIEKSAGKKLAITVERGGNRVDLSVTPTLGDQKDLFGNRLGRIGVMPSGERVKLGLAASLYEGFRFTLQTTDLMIVMLVNIVKGEASPKNLGGPIAIAQASGESLKQGLFAFIFLVSLISINLAIINLFPIPVLDGGHLLFFLVEAVIRRPVTGKAREAATFAGLLLIGLLTVFIFYNDIMRIVTQGWSLQP